MSLQDSFDAFSSSVTNLSGAVKTIADKVKDTRDNTYTKTQTDTMLGGKVDSTTFDTTVATVNASLDLKADASAVFTKDEATAANAAVLESLADTIGSLASAQGQIKSNGSPVFSSIPLTSTEMPFQVSIASSNVDVFDFDDVNNTITFKKEGSYTFTSNVGLRSSVSEPRTLTFSLVNTADSSSVSAETGTFDITSGSTQTIPMSTLVNVAANQLPLTIKIMAMSSGTGYALEGFSSTLVSSVKVTLTPDSIVGLPTALDAKLDKTDAAANSLQLGGIAASMYAQKATTLTGYGITDAATSAQGTKADAALPATGGVMTGQLTTKEEKVTVFTTATSTGSVVIDPANGSIQSTTLTGNVTGIDVSSMEDGQTIAWFFNPSTFAITWTGVTWLKAAPTLAASKVNVVSLHKVGGVVYGDYKGATV